MTHTPESCPMFSPFPMFNLSSWIVFVFFFCFFVWQHACSVVLFQMEHQVVVDANAKTANGGVSTVKPIIVATKAYTHISWSSIPLPFSRLITALKNTESAKKWVNRKEVVVKNRFAVLLCWFTLNQSLWQFWKGCRECALCIAGFVDIELKRWMQTKTKALETRHIDGCHYCRKAAPNRVGSQTERTGPCWRREKAVKNGK